MNIRCFGINEYKEFFEILSPYKYLKDYRYFFSSKEWIEAYTEIYKPSNIIFVKNKNSYISLIENEGSLYFLGSPFNDFNGINNIDNSNFDLNTLLCNLKEFKKKIKLENLFEKEVENYLKKNHKEYKTPCVLVSSLSKSFKCQVSNKIQRMYRKYKEDIVFKRILAKEIDDYFIKEIKIMLKFRQQNLIRFKGYNYNLSFENKFNQLILKLIKKMYDDLFIDLCFYKDCLCALSIYFQHKKNLIYYLRMHLKLGNQISIGLLLDYLSAIENDKLNIINWDFTRGNERYKYRLGGHNYLLYNFIVAN